jgi:hypothetical protein
VTEGRRDNPFWVRHEGGFINSNPLLESALLSFTLLTLSKTNKNHTACAQITFGGSCLSSCSCGSSALCSRLALLGLILDSRHALLLGQEVRQPHLATNQTLSDIQSHWECNKVPTLHGPQTLHAHSAKPMLKWVIKKGEGIRSLGASGMAPQEL